MATSACNHHTSCLHFVVQIMGLFRLGYNNIKLLWQVCILSTCYPMNKCWTAFLHHQGNAFSKPHNLDIIFILIIPYLARSKSSMLTVNQFFVTIRSVGHFAFLAHLFRRKSQAIETMGSSSACKTFNIAYNFVIPSHIYLTFGHIARAFRECKPI